MPLVLAAALPLLTEIFKLINNLIEAKPPAQRAAEAIIWFDITWTPIRGLFPPETQAAVDALMARAKTQAKME